MTAYRKFLEPEYGEPAPEVSIGKPQILDRERPDVWRRRNNLESVASMTQAMMGLSCYEEMMAVEAEDLFVDNEGYPVPIRVYYPDREGTYPVLLFLHGGGFEYNNIDVYEYVNRYMCSRGKLVVIGVDYRLSPEHKYPTALNDCYQVLVWAEKNLSRIRGKEGCISVGGDSAGGNLTAAITLRSRDENGPGIRSQILVYPQTIHQQEELTTSGERYRKGYFLEWDPTVPNLTLFADPEDRLQPLASPLLAEDLTNLPPACFVSAECDPLLDQGLMYAARLEDSGIPVEYHIFKGMIHGFLNGSYGKSFEALETIAEFANR